MADRICRRNRDYGPHAFVTCSGSQPWWYDSGGLVVWWFAGLVAWWVATRWFAALSFPLHTCREACRPPALSLRHGRNVLRVVASTRSLPHVHDSRMRMFLLQQWVHAPAEHVAQLPLDLLMR